MGRLDDQVALITGADSGIGQATAVEFAREGADVIVNYLEDEQGANHTREAVQAQGRRAIVVQADHGYEDQVERMFGAAIAEFGHIDILMNNASVDASGVYVADLDFAAFQRTIRSNVFGQILCAKHFIRHRKDNGGSGKIINVTSIHEDIPNAGGADYDCSKGALRMLTRTLAIEVAPDAINVNSLAPGMVLTPFNQAAIDDPKLLEQQVQNIPLKRAAQPEEIAKLALSSPPATRTTSPGPSTSWTAGSCAASAKAPEPPPSPGDRAHHRQAGRLGPAPSGGELLHDARHRPARR